jgi:hypothetical protein
MINVQNIIDVFAINNFYKNSISMYNINQVDGIQLTSDYFHIFIFSVDVYFINFFFIILKYINITYRYIQNINVTSRFAVF